MTRSSSERELKSYEREARKEEFKQGWERGGFGWASIWVYPIVVLAFLILNGFVVGLPRTTGTVFEPSLFGWIALVPGAILVLVGLFRPRGRWWSFFGAALHWFLNPYSVMLFILPFVEKAPDWLAGIWDNLFG